MSRIQELTYYLTAGQSTRVPVKMLQTFGRKQHHLNKKALQIVAILFFIGWLYKRSQIYLQCCREAVSLLMALVVIISNYLAGNDKTRVLR